VALPSLAEHPRHDRRRTPAATPTIAFPLAQSRGRDIDPCSHPAGASGHETSAGAVNSLRKQLFLTSSQVRCIGWPHYCGTQADQLQPIKRCDDLATGRRSWQGEGPAGLFLPDELMQNLGLRGRVRARPSAPLI